MTWRLRLLTGCIVGLWSIVAVRLLFVQGWQHAEYSVQAHRQQRLVESIPARPGDILDRRGRLLATTLKVHSLYVDPSRIESARQVAAELAKALHLEAEELTTHLESQRARQFLWIKRRLTEEEEQRVLALDLPWHVCGLREEFCRSYPHRRLAAHVLGWRDIDGRGQSGVERSLESRLAGEDGERTLVRDARGFVVHILDEVTRPPRHGASIRLTIDLDVQAFVEDALDELCDEWRPVGASVVVMDPQTGKVLAMASRPTFDANDPAAFDVSTWRNSAVAQAFEPGSTIKPLIAAWALQTQEVQQDDVFDCKQGEYRMGRRLLHDSHPYGRLSLTDVLVKSSNIGMAQVGERLSNDGLYRALQTFGFGRRTGIELSEERTGVVREFEKWDAYSTGSIPMGQEVSATPLQIITAHAALANGGRLISPHLVGQQTSRSTRATQIKETRILDEAIARWIVQEPLTRVVIEGTARRAQLENLAVFAKTGTAQKFDAESGAYAKRRYVSSCICGAPAANPQALVLVTVDEAKSEQEPFGGVVAAPTASRILDAALRLTHVNVNIAGRHELRSR